MITAIQVLVFGGAVALVLFWGIRLRWSEAEDEWTASPSVPRIVASILLGIFGMMLSMGLGQVDEGERGVVLSFGRATGRIIDPGVYVVTPFVESVTTMPVRVVAEKANAEGASKDLQVVHAEITVNYALRPEDTVRVYSRLGKEALERVIKPAIEEAVKAGTAEFKAEELITHRPQVKSRIESILRSRLEANGFHLDAVSITDFDFSDTFNRSIEAKVTATQEALKAQNELVRVQAEAQQQVERARAEAEALKVQRDAVTPELLELRKVEALMKSLEKWDGRLPQYVGGSGGPVPVLEVFRNAKETR